MNTHPRIHIDPSICHGKPVIADTRVPVSIIVGALAGGMSMEEITREYDVAQEDIRAALAFANDLILEESFHSLPRVA